MLEASSIIPTVVLGGYSRDHINPSGQARLKKNLFLVERPGDLKKGATGDFFFFHFCKQKQKNSNIDNIFLPNKTKKYGGGGGDCGRPTGHNYGHPLDRKQTLFFCGQPQVGRGCMKVISHLPPGRKFLVV